MSQNQKAQQFRDRIVRFGVKPASEFLANPHNPRRHPEMQRRAVKASLQTLGWIAPVIELADGYLLDGHERVWQASALGDDTPVPYIVVDLSESEARQALATFDYITYLARYDRDVLEDLLDTVKTDDETIRQLLDDLRCGEGADACRFHQADAPAADGGFLVTARLSSELYTRFMALPGDDDTQRLVFLLVNHHD